MNPASRERAPGREARGPGRIFALPLLIAITSLIGLVMALLGDGVLDLLSWVGLAVPVAMVVWAMRTRRR